MPTSAGPNILGESNLVFNYDTGDTVNSYKGQPTTNEVLYSEQFNQSYWLKGAASITANATIAPDGTQTADYLVENTASDTHQVYLYLTGKATGFYTFSVYAKAGARTRMTIALYGDGGAFNYQPWFDLITGTVFTNSGGGTATIQPVGNGWYRCSISGNCTIGNFYPLFRLVQSPSSEAYTGNGSSGVYFWGAQLEYKPQPTPYIATTTTTSTRSNTQGLLDISGYNTTIDLSNMAYTSTAGLLFNGSTTKINPTTVWSYLSSSAMECVFNTATVSGLKTVFGYSQNDGYSQPTIGSIYLDSNALRASVITSAEVYRTVTASTTIAANTFYHVVLNKDTIGGNLQLYVNGVLNGTQTFNAATYGQWSSPGNYIGSNLLDIGKSTNTNVGQGWSTSALSGSIPLTKIYNRTLLATEILNNYSELKTRFNLS